MRDINPVIFHRPGQAWNHALPLFEQSGLQDHLEHYRALRERGLISLGGPFMDEGGGGMMVGAARLSMAEAVAFAAQDPCVVSGLLIAEVRPWYQAMKS